MGSPSSLHATLASFFVNPSSQTVPHDPRPSSLTSKRPFVAYEPFTSRMLSDLLTNKKRINYKKSLQITDHPKRTCQREEGQVTADNSCVVGMATG